MAKKESTSVVFRDDLSSHLREYDSQAAAARFIGLKAAPIRPVAKKAGQFAIFRRADMKKPADVSRAAGGDYNRIQTRFGAGTYACVEHGLEHPIDDGDREEYIDQFDADSEAAEALRFQILMAHERRVAALYAAAGLTNHNVGTAWTTVATASPLDDIQTGIDTVQDACGVGGEAMSLIIPRVDFREALKTAAVIAKLPTLFPGVQPALIQPAQFAAMLGIKSVLVAGGVYDSAGEGLAEVNTQIWTGGVMYLAVLAEPNASLITPSAARTILWTRRSPSLPVVESYREDKIASDIIRVRDDTDEIMQGPANLFAYQITNT